MLTNYGTCVIARATRIQPGDIVFQSDTPGNYTYTIKKPGTYEITISGGGGSGSSMALRNTGGTSNRVHHNGYNGELAVSTITLTNGQVISGVVGGGAEGSYTYARTSYHNRYAGEPGTGYQSGTKGTTAGNGDLHQVAAGSGGGSTSLEIDNVLQTVAKGGNGGANSVTITPFDDPTPITISTTGGTGGSGGTTAGTGAAGGAYSYGTGEGSANTSGPGENGYVSIKFIS